MSTEPNPKDVKELANELGVSLPSLNLGLREAQLAARFILQREAKLVEALEAILDRYVTLVNSGDVGNWDPEREVEVINARKILPQTTEQREQLDELNKRNLGTL